MKKYILAVFFGCIAPCVAALPPFAQSKKEIEAIFNSAEINQHIPQEETILQFTKIDNSYLVVTNTYRSILIDVHYLPSQKVGPVAFTLEFHSLES